MVFGVNGIRIRGEVLPRLRHRKRLSAAKLGSLAGYTHRQISRLENGAPTSLRFLDSLVPIFGIEPVAELIVDAEQREIFIAAHQEER